MMSTLKFAVFALGISLYRDAKLFMGRIAPMTWVCGSLNIW